MGRLYARSIYSIFSLYMESNASEKSTNNRVASRFFAYSPVLPQVVKIFEFVDGFLRKPFWLFLRIFSIVGRIRLKSKVL